MSKSEKINIVIAGASGYIGRALLPVLLERFPQSRIIALSRTQQKSDDERVLWQACDLFSLKSIEDVMPRKIDLAIYLVHSMGPTAQLDQGSFADYDLLLADNFARAMQQKELKQIIYLGGLIPEAENLSLHLRSRLEVEEVFRQHNLPCTIFRAGLILGAEGSSFQILLKLVKRLPVMICPQWTQTLTTPVDLKTVLLAISSAALDGQHLGRIYDLAGCKPLTYIQMMQETARRIGLKRYFITVPFFTPTLSRLWVTLITNTPKDLVYPLVESLEHPMVARKNHLFGDVLINRTYYELLESAFFKIRSKTIFFHFRAKSKTVRSVQRLTLAKGKSAAWVKEQYLRWLPVRMWPLIIIQQTNDDTQLLLRFLKINLLTLRANRSRSTSESQLFDIVDGVLVSGAKRGRLEFREVLSKRYVLAAIHDFEPALPWFIYTFTQAIVHLIVMRAFARHLERCAIDSELNDGAL